MGMSCFPKLDIFHFVLFWGCRSIAGGTVNGELLIRIVWFLLHTGDRALFAGGNRNGYNVLDSRSSADRTKCLCDNVRY